MRSSLTNFVHEEQRRIVEALVMLGGHYPYCRSGMDGDCGWEHCPQKEHYRQGCILYDWDDPDAR